MIPPIQLILVFLPVPFFVFWLWMFRDLTNNDYLSKNSKDNWTLAFIFMNIFAAGLYYYYEYRPRHM